MWLTLTDTDGVTIDINTDHIAVIGPPPDHSTGSRITLNLPPAARTLHVRQPRDLIRAAIQGADPYDHTDLTIAYQLTHTNLNGDTLHTSTQPGPGAAWYAAAYLTRLDHDELLNLARTADSGSHLNHDGTTWTVTPTNY